VRRRLLALADALSHLGLVDDNLRIPKTVLGTSSEVGVIPRDRFLFNGKVVPLLLLQGIEQRHWLVCPCQVVVEDRPVVERCIFFLKEGLNLEVSVLELKLFRGPLLTDNQLSYFLETQGLHLVLEAFAFSWGLRVLVFNVHHVVEGGALGSRLIEVIVQRDATTHNVMCQKTSLIDLVYLHLIGVHFSVALPGLIQLWAHGQQDVLAGD